MAMASQHYCLRWNNYQSNMTSVFHHLLRTEAFVDVTLACDDLSLKAHKVVLSACSSYFQKLLLENPCPHPTIIMPQDVCFADLKFIIEFVYRGEIDVSQAELQSLLKTADQLKIKGLCEMPEANHYGEETQRWANHREDEMRRANHDEDEVRRTFTKLRRVSGSKRARRTLFHDQVDIDLTESTDRVTVATSTDEDVPIVVLESHGLHDAHYNNNNTSIENNNCNGIDHSGRHNGIDGINNNINNNNNNSHNNNNNNNNISNNNNNNNNNNNDSKCRNTLEAVEPVGLSECVEPPAPTATRVPAEAEPGLAVGSVLAAPTTNSTSSVKLETLRAAVDREDEHGDGDEEEEEDDDHGMMITPELLGLVPTGSLHLHHDSDGMCGDDGGGGGGVNGAGKVKSWCPEDMELALDALRNRHLSLTKASATFGIPSTTLWQRAHRLGIGTPKKDGPSKGWTDDVLHSALQALRSGALSANKASKAFGIPSSTLYKVARREGIRLAAPFNAAPTTWSPGDLERALDSIRQGAASVQRAATQFGIPTGTLYGRCKREGIELSRSNPTPWSEGAMGEALEAVRVGQMSINQAAIHYSLPYSSLYGRFKRCKYEAEGPPGEEAFAMAS